MKLSRHIWSHPSLGRAGLGILAAALAAGLAWAPGEGRAQEACDDPAILRFAVSAGGNPQDRLAHFMPILDFLRERTKRKVEIVIPATYDSTTKGVAEGWIDVAAYTANSYVTARGKSPAVEPFAAYARKPGHLQSEAPGYQLVLISRKGGGFAKLRATEGAVLGLIEQNSVAGDLLPRVTFAKAIDGELEAHFSEVLYTGGNDLSTMAVYEGKIDVAIVASHRFDEMVDNEMVLLEEFNVLWRSPTIPDDPIAYRSGLCGDLKKEIAGAFLNLHSQYQAKSFLEKHKAGRMVPVSDADYAVLREVRVAKERLKQKAKGKIN